MEILIKKILKYVANFRNRIAGYQIGLMVTGFSVRLLLKQQIMVCLFDDWKIFLKRDKEMTVIFGLVIDV